MSIGISAAQAAEIERLRRALQIIMTWAQFDEGAGRVALQPADVIEVCRKALEVRSD